MYNYDTKTKQFKIQNDANRYTQSELSWNYMDEYEIYSVLLKDQKYFDINAGLKEVPLKDPVDYEFDVSPGGKFVRLEYIYIRG